MGLMVVGRKVAETAEGGRLDSAAGAVAAKIKRAWQQGEFHPASCPPAESPRSRPAHVLVWSRGLGKGVDSSLGQVGKEPCGRREIIVVMQDHESADGGARADQQVYARQRSVRSGAHQAILRGLDPLPRRLRYRDIRIEVKEHGGHLLVLVEVAGRAAKLGALRLA